MKKPYSKFFWSDWRNEMTLKLCSLAARGLWMEMMAIMGLSEKIGYLQIGGKVITEEQLAVLLGCTMDEIRNCLNELEGHGVFSRDENGVPYSRRMAREAKSYLEAKEYGTMGGNPILIAKKQEAKEAISNSLESISQNLEATDGIRGGDKGRDNPQQLTWKTSYEIYLDECTIAYEALSANTDWIKQQEKFHPNIDIPLSLEKAFTNFWGTEAGWKHKKKARSKEINWKTTFTNAIDMNKVYKPRYGNNDAEKGRFTSV